MWNFKKHGFTFSTKKNVENKFHTCAPTNMRLCRCRNFVDLSSFPGHCPRFPGAVRGRIGADRVIAGVFSTHLSNCGRIFHTSMCLDIFSFSTHSQLWNLFCGIQSVEFFDVWNFDVDFFFFSTRQTNLWKTKFHKTIPQIRKCGNAKSLK